VVEFRPAAEIPSDGAARIVLAKEVLSGKTPRIQEIVVRTPVEVGWYPSAARIPTVPGRESWFEWKGTGRISEGSVVSLAGWQDGPAGQYGRVKSEKDHLVYHGKRTVFWGINICYASTSPPKEEAERRAQFYADHGINAVRLHKYADGSGWAGILAKDTFTEFDPAALDRMDYFVAKLKEKGIFIKLSPTFGTFRLGARDAGRVPYLNEMSKGKFPVETPHGAAYLGEELRDLQITQMVNLLNHRNPYTGLTYAEDPAVMVVELLNEQSSLFFGTMGVLKSVPTLRKRAAARFTDWLLQRYGSKEAVLARWGKGGLDAFAGEGFQGESFEEKSIVPVGNPWFYDPAQLDGPQKSKKPRLLDTMLFLYELQNEFYQTYTRALRQAGYTGEIVASNWQAGRAFSHFYNLHSDALAGIVDRHNYYTGKVPMLQRPGSGMLSAGMQQVEGRPFMLSEWIHVFPTSYAFEGPAIIGAFGMGLQGWDVSYLFQNRDTGTYEKQLGTDRWVVMQPEIIGLFPAIARQVRRGDVRVSDVIVRRLVHVPSLHEGKLGFDDQVQQGYDEKSFESRTVPSSSLAVVRSVVSFGDAYEETKGFDVAPYWKGGKMVSSTGELAWKPGEKALDGYFTINTPATKAVVGFVAGEEQELGDVTIMPETRGAAIYLTASEADKTLADSQRVLLVTMARSRNEGMVLMDGKLLAKGNAPILVEPVKARIGWKQRGNFTVHILDHDGNDTGRTVPVENGVFTVDGAETRTVYYEIRF
jgi:hypothetical protein